MEKNVRLVINLMKDTIKNNQVNQENYMTARKEIANAITRERILGNSTEDLEELIQDVEFLSNYYE